MIKTPGAGPLPAAGFASFAATEGRHWSCAAAWQPGKKVRARKTIVAHEPFAFDSDGCSVCCAGVFVLFRDWRVSVDVLQQKQVSCEAFVAWS